ncbi:uncharacterized protein BDZ99DRAFT_498742 [Mytilinidion resinicola]|uniref:Uncharacterized protein n=1 Tax=Mytilinidion resinicola TaxID=574789 RepID=A0A6A6YKK1_9PEZI|nr:uncharacterized protein BDZ99DRAFT_498742 [Mytilinidion resinicola]KAF2809351.1 hypothetical protein BDZ99DRAFT_498742 [Mytilinidion resinicola]
MAKGKGLFAAIGAGTAISAIAGTYKLSEFLVRAKKLHEVGRENEVFMRLVRRVNEDLGETRRLVQLEEVEYALSTAPEKVAWINSVMKSTRGALERMMPLVEPVAADTEGGHHVGLRHRMKWVLDTKERLVNHNLELVACHNSLTQVLGFLAAMEPLACCVAEKKGKQQQQQQQQQQQRTVTREIDVEFDKKRGGHKDLQFERRHQGPPREIRYQAEVRREGPQGPPQDFQYQADIRRGGPPQNFGPPPQDFGPPQDFRYERELRREGGRPEFQYRAEVRRNGGGQEEWIEEREVRRDQKPYYTPDPRDVPRMTTWPRSRL